MSKMADGIIYRGARWADTTVQIEINGRNAGLLPHAVKHSPTGFEWAYEGSGPADLARSLLIYSLEIPACEECAGNGCWSCDAGYLIEPAMYQQFKRDVVARLPRAGFTLSRAEILDWVARYEKSK